MNEPQNLPHQKQSFSRDQGMYQRRLSINSEVSFAHACTYTWMACRQVSAGGGGQITLSFCLSFCCFVSTECPRLILSLPERRLSFLSLACMPTTPFNTCTKTCLNGIWRVCNARTRKRGEKDSKQHSEFCTALVRLFCQLALPQSHCRFLHSVFNAVCEILHVVEKSYRYCHRHRFHLFIVFASLVNMRLVSQLIIFQLSYQLATTLHRISTHIKLSVLKF